MRAPLPKDRRIPDPLPVAAGKALPFRISPARKAGCGLSLRTLRSRFFGGIGDAMRHFEAAAAEALSASPPAPLGGLFEAFRKHLHPSLSPAAFAEELAQGVAMGFLAADACFEEPLSRSETCAYLASLSPACREVFSLAAPGALPGALDRACEALLAAANPPARLILAEELESDAPLGRLFEAFLSHCAPRMRSRRGIYLTPQPLASYIVRSADFLLRTRFGMGAGLAAPGVRILDPASGAGIFLEEALLCAAARMEDDPKATLPELRGFELSLPAYVVSLMSFDAFREKAAWFRRPAKICLTDALADPGEASNDPLTREMAAGWAHRANPVLAVLGNPPFLGHSENRGRWISDLLRGAGGEPSYLPRGERNTKWLQDDYVKFLRLAQWMIEQNGEGIVGVVVNHNCLDAITFSGLRASLLENFEEIFVLDLHGNRRKRETAGGRQDENVFEGVAQGVAVLLLVKKAGLERRSYRADRYGSRTEKLRFLGRKSAATTRWMEIPPHSPMTSAVLNARSSTAARTFPPSPAYPSRIGRPNAGEVCLHEGGSETQYGSLPPLFSP